MEPWLAQIEQSVARYLSRLDTGDLQESTEALAAKTAHVKEKLAKLATEMPRLKAIDKEMLASPDQQISLTDLESRSMAASGRGSGVVSYNGQVTVDTEHHLIVMHEVTNTGSDRSQLAKVASQAKDILVDHLDAVADRGDFNSPEILACEQADITVTLPKPMTSGAKSDGCSAIEAKAVFDEMRRTADVVDVGEGAGHRLSLVQEIDSFECRGIPRECRGMRVECNKSP